MRRPGSRRASTQKSLFRPAPRSMNTPATTGPKTAIAALVSGSVSLAAQARLVEEEGHPLAGNLRRKAQRPEVLVVDDLVAVALEDVQLEPLPVARRRQAEAALRGDLRVLLDHLAEPAARRSEADRHAQ